MIGRTGGRRRLPEPLDLTRLVLARASTRLALDHANDAFSDALLLAFRRELGATVRSVSPLLVALLDACAMDLDECVSSIRPVPGWPDRPTLPVSGPHRDGSKGTVRGGSEAAWRARAKAFAPHDCHACTIYPAGGERLTVHVVDHSIEVAAWLGPIRLRSLFGAFQLSMPRDEWRAPYPPHAGDDLDALVGHPGLRDRG